MRAHYKTRGSPRIKGQFNRQSSGGSGRFAVGATYEWLLLVAHKPVTGLLWGKSPDLVAESASRNRLTVRFTPHIAKKLVELSRGAANFSSKHSYANGS